MITQSGNNTKTDQVVAFIGMMTLPVGLSAFLIWLAVDFILSN